MSCYNLRHVLCLLLCQPSYVNLAGSSRDHNLDRQGEEDYLQKANLPVRPSWVPGYQHNKHQELMKPE